MGLNDIFSENGTLTVPGYSNRDFFNSSNITMTGNGYLGFRGTFPDWGKDRFAACTVSGTYDLADGKWKELCNVPNGMFLEAACAGGILDIAAPSCIDFRHGLDFRYGISRGSGRWEEEDGNTVEMSWSRYASLSDLHLVVQCIEITAERDGIISIRSGIDGEVWSLNGNHFSAAGYSLEEGGLGCDVITEEKRMPIAVRHRLITSITEMNVETGENGIFRRFDIPVKTGITCSLVQMMTVFTGADSENPAADAEMLMEQAGERGYAALLESHKQAWDAEWNALGITIDGDALAENLIRYNLYHNRIATPAHSDRLPVGARGLSCQAYQGAAFWDQEVFNLPTFLYTRPEIARRLLMYRYHTLAGAKKKAADLGYAGAFYAWISGDSGEELCPDYFFQDVITGRKIRNHFNDWQIHISPDISYTIIRYFETTGDWDFICNYGAEMLMEIALFLYSRVHFRPYLDRYEILRVLGPDEYHENADNNAFTNFQVKFALGKTLEIAERLRKEDADQFRNLQKRTGVTDTVLTGLKIVARKMFVRQPDSRTGIIEQFDGYFDLEDIRPKDLEKRLIDDQEYWGWPNGIAFETQVTKQADVIQMFVLHDFPESIMQANYRYYEPRTQHRSSLSPGVHAIVAARTGQADEAYDYLIRSCSVDAANTHPPTSGGTFIGGIHTAACGISWQILVLGFAGMKTDGDCISFAPELPGHWQGIGFTIRYRGCRLRVRLSNSECHFEWERSSSGALRIRCFGEEYMLDSRGQSRIVAPKASETT